MGVGFEQGVNTEGEVMRDVYVKHDPVDIDCSHDGMTRQEFAAECDINVLLDRYEKTGVLTHYSQREPMYLDLTENPHDLQSALAVLDQAQAAFMTLPAKVRREFDQDPLKFVEFAEDPKNVDWMREHGLARPIAAEPGPVRVEIVGGAANVNEPSLEASSAPAAPASSSKAKK